MEFWKIEVFLVPESGSMMLDPTRSSLKGGVLVLSEHLIVVRSLPQNK